MGNFIVTIFLNGKVLSTIYNPVIWSVYGDRFYFVSTRIYFVWYGTVSSTIATVWIFILVVAVLCQKYWRICIASETTFLRIKKFLAAFACPLMEKISNTMYEQFHAEWLVALINKRKSRRINFRSKYGWQKEDIQNYLISISNINTCLAEMENVRT